MIAATENGPTSAFQTPAQGRAVLFSGPGAGAMARHSLVSASARYGRLSGGRSHDHAEADAIWLPSAWTAALAAAGVVTVFGGVIWLVRRQQRGRAVRSLSRKLSNCAIDEEEGEVELVKQGSGTAGLPPILFVHGGFHGAWCWQEHAMGWLAERGWACYAVNLPGRGRSSGFAPAVTLGQCVRALNHAVKKIAKENPGCRPPVLVGHSAGGGVVQAAVAGAQVLPKASVCWFFRILPWKRYEVEGPEVTAVALLASFPPCGGRRALFRWAWRKKWVWLLVWLTFNPKTLLGTPALFKEMMLSDDFSEENDLIRLHSYLEPHESHVLPLQLSFRFAHPQRLRAAGVALPPAFVLGGLSDRIFSAEEIHRTAEEWGTEPFLIKGLAHDVMLDDRWEKAVTLLEAWLRNLPSAQQKQ